MDTPRRGRRDLLQNIAIVLLSLSAVFLFTRSQLYMLVGDREGGYLEQLVSRPGDSGAVHPLSAPVRVVVTGAYDRFGAALTTQDEDFADLGILLKGALGSAGALAPSTGERFFSALSSPCVYYDFLEPLPLSVLAGLVGGVCSSEELVRYLVIADSGGTSLLYTWDGGDRCLSCQVPIPGEQLSSLAVSRSMEAVFFAFDNADTAPGYSRLSPVSLLFAEPPALPVLSASPSLTDPNRLLPAFGFNPNTKSRYLESSGTEVIMKEGATLRLGTDGTLHYQGDAAAGPEIPAREEVPTLQEAAAGTGALLSRLLEGASGEAELYLQSIRRSEGETALTFEFHRNGVPIRSARGEPAARVTLSGAFVTDLSLRFRQYTASGETSLLLPLRQTLAIAAGHQGAELSIGYADRGGGTVSAGWLAD